MLINDLLDRIDINNNRSFYSIETFIIYLLKSHLEKNNKPFVRGNVRMSFDAFAAEGIEDIEGATQIDIRFNLDRLPISKLIEQYSQQISREINKDFSNILIICPTDISKRTKIRFEELQKNEILYNLILWGPEEINKIVSKNRKEANEIANNLFSLRIESAVSETSKNWENERREKIEFLKSFYRKGQFSFFLGAGVSSSAGMPDWNTLINSLFVTFLTKEFNHGNSVVESDIKEIVKRLNEVDEQSALMSARYLRKGLNRNTSESKEFTQAITKNLYGLRNANKQIDSELIKSIVEMCMPKRTGAKIKSVVTYNFDDLIERQLKNQSIQFHSIYSDNDIIDPDELPVYHVHGFLPENITEYESLEKSTLVFSEEGYHHIYSDSYHWSNLVQLSQLRDSHCLMVGLSMSDPNLRRLLEIASRNTDKPRHFAFMKRLTINNFTFEKEEQVIQNERSAEIFLNRHHNLNEEIMRELGVSIIWYTDYEEIPKLLNDIKK